MVKVKKVKEKYKINIIKIKIIRMLNKTKVYILY